ncbi:MAG: universal stress protein [Chloroflexi bacterium]|nr:universal stress protein [Chloroflexota bacterium]
MYDRILVALDGSDLAERVLPYVEALAEKFGSVVTLVRATTPPGALTVGAPGSVPVPVPILDPKPIVEAERRETSAYLSDLAIRLRSQGLTVACEQPEGFAADVIVMQAGALPADLIAMTTHGRGGLGRALFGSVADEVLRSASCPVLLVRVHD